MGQPAAKQGDRIIGTDTHVIMVSSPGGPVPTPTPMPFSGQLDGALSADVVIDGKPAAVEGSTASNAPVPCERMKVTVADAKGETRDYVTAPDGTIRVAFGPEEKSGALRIVGMRHADDEDRTIHTTDIGRS